MVSWFLTDRINVVICMYSSLVGELLFAARAALLACVGGLAFLMRVCLRWFPALNSDCLCMPNHHVSLYRASSVQLRQDAGWSIFELQC